MAHFFKFSDIIVKQTKDTTMDLGLKKVFKNFEKND